MPMADYRCEACGAVVERFFHHPPEEVPCETEGCPGPARRTFEPSIAMRRPRSMAQSFAPVVVHKDAQGNYRFPGSPDAAVPPGFERVELRTTAEVRRFERDVNRAEAERHDGAQVREEGFYAGFKAQQRAELRAAMARMSPAGRDFAREAMRANDERPRGRFDAGFYVESFSVDSSNREPQRDESTGWRTKKG